MSGHQQFDRVSEIGVYDYAHVDAFAASSTKIGVTGRGTYLGRVIVGSKGSGCVLTLMDGSAVVSVIALDSLPSPVVEFGVGLDAGLSYTLSGTTIPDLTITYLDYAF